MRIHQLIFGLVENFVPIDQKDLAELKDEIEKDYKKIRFDDNLKPEEITWKEKAKKLVENPYFRLLTAVCYLPLAIMIKKEIVYIETPTEKIIENENNTLFKR